MGHLQTPIVSRKQPFERPVLDVKQTSEGATFYWDMPLTGHDLYQ
jgi:hypothetical protein